MVHGLALRHGKRARRADGQGDLTTRKRTKSRKDSQFHYAIHPDAQACFDALSGVDTAHAHQVVARAEEVYDQLILGRDMGVSADHMPVYTARCA